MNAILFSKLFKDRDPGGLVDLAHSLGVAGYDLAVRSGHPVNPDNAERELPRVAELMRRSDLDVPMVTGNFDLLEPSHPSAAPILRGMDAADVRLLKLGYFRYRPGEEAYTERVDHVRDVLLEWEPVARQYGVKVCYHTHSGHYMGMNCASLMHLLSGFDPECVGAYLDPGHLVVSGEGFATGLPMAGEYFSLVAVKDVLLKRAERGDHGGVTAEWVPAGRGMVDWTEVFDRLEAVGYDGPVSIHCGFDVPEDEFMDTVRRETAFFGRLIGS